MGDEAMFRRQPVTRKYTLKDGSVSVYHTSTLVKVKGNRTKLDPKDVVQYLALIGEGHTADEACRRLRITKSSVQKAMTTILASHAANINQLLGDPVNSRLTGRLVVS